MNGSFFTAARAVTGLTVAQIASATSLSVSTIRNLEGGTGERGKSALLEYFASSGIHVDEKERSVALTLGEGRSFGTLVSVARNIVGLSQQAIAALSGVSLRTINGIEKSSVVPTATNQAAITDALSRYGIRIGRDHTSENLWVVSRTPEGIPHTESDDQANEDEIGCDMLDDPRARERTDLLKLRIELYELNPPVWREIVIPRNATFFDLHAAIQIAFGWTNKYTHEFRCGVVIGTSNARESGLDFSDDLDERLVRLEQVYFRTGEFEYRYGKGEHWLAKITIIERMSGENTPTNPVLLAGQGANFPEEAWAEQWTTDAAALRKKKASNDTLDWLHFLGFGRDYNPDHLDIDAINADFANAGFAIPATKADDYRRRRELESAVEPVLPKSLPRKRDKATIASGGFVVSKIEENGPGDVIFDPKHGLMTTYPEKAGGNAQIRGTHGELAHVFELAHDVESFTTFPLSIHWSSGSSKGIFQPDFKMKDTAGNEYLLHVTYSTEEEDFVAAIAAKTSLAIKTIGCGVMNDTIVECCYCIDRDGRWVKAIEAEGIAESLKIENLQKPVPVSKAVSDLTIAGFGKQLEGFTGGRPESMTKRRLAVAVKIGDVGMDFSKPFESTFIGKRELTRETFSLALLLDKYS